MSRATGLIFFVGAREKMWMLEAVDWYSGLPVFSVPLSRKPRHNSYYAGTEIGADAELVSGAFGGLMRFRPE